MSTILLSLSIVLALACAETSASLAGRQGPPTVATPAGIGDVTTATRIADSFSADPQSRDDRGCCVIKPGAVKSGWTYYDNYTRGSCVDAARQVNVNWDFYKDKSCNAVK